MNTFSCYNLKFVSILLLRSLSAETKKKAFFNSDRRFFSTEFIYSIKKFVIIFYCELSMLKFLFLLEVGRDKTLN